MASPLPLVLVGIPIACALLVALTGERFRNLRDAWPLGAALAAVGVGLALLGPALDGVPRESHLWELAPGIAVAFRADAAGLVFALLASMLWVLAAPYAVGYMRAEGEERQTRFFTAYALSVGAALGVALAANLLTFVLCYELLSLFTYPLVTHRQTEEALAAGRKYLAYTLSGGLALIAATAWLAALGVDATFTPGGFLASAGLDGPTRWLLFGLLACGVGVKAAVMPLHSWLPSAMVAPTPVSALLHAVAVVKAGVFGMVRVTAFVFGPVLLLEMGASAVLAAFAATTLLVGSALALRHDNLKRRLAYSTISHLSYIVLGIALAHPMALLGALLHLVGHGVTKITLFFAAGAIHAHTHRENVSDLNGVGRQMPVTMGAFTLASLSMAGIPPFILFVSKWYLGAGAASGGQHLYLITYILSGLLSAGYLFPIVVRAFFRKAAPIQIAPHREDDGQEDHEEVAQHLHVPDPEHRAWLMVAPIALTGVLTLWLGLFPDTPMRFLELANAVAGVHAGGKP
ncbi:MAG: proton-conducting transporter membrane subunit [Chloroflexota bacterium]